MSDTRVNRYGVGAVVFWLAMAGAAGATEDVALRLDPPWGEHMVLQADRPVRPSGRARKGEEVRGTFRGQVRTTRADDAGRWVLEWPAVPAGGPYRLAVACGSERIEWRDLLAGEVWLASGQSNMEWKLGPTRHAGEALDGADRQDLRLFTVPRDLGPARGGPFQGAWEVCTSESARDFSAVAYHCGTELQRHRPGPVGLVCAAWGGTPGETWTPRESIEEVPALAPILQRWNSKPAEEQNMYLEGLPFELQLRNPAWEYADGRTEPVRILQRDVKASHGAVTRYEPGRYHGRVAGGGWATAHAYLTGHEGETVDLRDVRRLRFEARGACAFDVALTPRGIDDGDYHALPRFEVAADWKPYTFELKDLRQGGWGAKRDLDLGAIQVMALRVQAPSQLPDQPGLLFDAMIRPLRRFPFRGALWYQGESNLGRHEEYRVLLQTLVNGWRSVFHDPDLAFLVVQLPDFGAPGEDENGGEGFPPFRLAQAGVLDLPRTGLVVTLGLGEGTDWHPRHKRPVGQRLAWEALRVVYGREDMSGIGPAPHALTREGRALIVTFQSVGDLVVEGDRLLGFELAGDDGAWQPAEAQMRDGRVHLSHPDVPVPARVRYGWGDNPVATLRDARGLPALPFAMPCPRRMPSRRAPSPEPDGP